MSRRLLQCVAFAVIALGVAKQRPLYANTVGYCEDQCDDECPYDGNAYCDSLSGTEDCLFAFCDSQDQDDNCGGGAYIHCGVKP